jgi:broad specificity phosphatase PhoE
VTITYTRKTILLKKLILIRHSISNLDPDLSPHQWGLTDEGRMCCIPLAKQLQIHEPEIVITSIEPKAIQTGEIVAQELGISCWTADGLHEHEREQSNILGQEEWEKQIANLFASPDTLIFGKETANQALVRFAGAVESILSTYPHKKIAVVTHGTVMSLFYSQITGRDAFKFWRELESPAFYVASWPYYIVTSLATQIETF